MLAEILNCERLTAIVDVGASPIDGPAPYKAMLDQRLCTVLGFEPNQSALEALNASKTDLETYRPTVIGDGGKTNLFHCKELGMTSTLRPDPAALKCFPPFKNWSEIIQTDWVDTTCLHEAVEGEMDMLKIDIQGGEFGIFEAAPELMKRAVCVHTEVAFVTLYENQPTFGEIDMQLRSYGFVPHCLYAFKRWMIAPLHSPSNPTKSINQLLDGDMVYVRDFTKMDAMSDEQLQHLAMLAHYCYGSTDLAVRCLTVLGWRGRIGKDAAAKYLSGTKVP